MALKNNELLTSVERASYPRVMPYEGGVRSKKFAAAAGGPTLAILTPIAKDSVTGNFKVWDNAGANGGNVIVAFVYPNEITLDAADEVLGNLLFRGEVHYEDIPLPAGQLQANLDAALLVGPRSLGLDIQGLEGVV